jgi:hypothetical protein
MADEVLHTDILGNDIFTSSKLAVSKKNSLVICSVVNISPKMIRVSSIARPSWSFLVYPRDTVVVSGPDALAYLLRA